VGRVEDGDLANPAERDVDEETEEGEEPLVDSGAR